MPCCSAVGCSNTGKSGYKLFRFPRDEKRRKQWAVNVRRLDPKGKLWIPDKLSGSVLCEVHFEQNQFEPKRSDKRLKCDAVPTIFENIETNDSSDKCKRTEVQIEASVQPPKRIKSMECESNLNEVDSVLVVKEQTLPDIQMDYEDSAVLQSSDIIAEYPSNSTEHVTVIEYVYEPDESHEATGVIHLDPNQQTEGENTSHRTVRCNNVRRSIVEHAYAARPAETKESLTWKPVLKLPENVRMSPISHQNGPPPAVTFPRDAVPEIKLPSKDDPIIISKDELKVVVPPKTDPHEKTIDALLKEIARKNAEFETLKKEHEITQRSLSEREKTIESMLQQMAVKNSEIDKIRKKKHIVEKHLSVMKRRYEQLKFTLMSFLNEDQVEAMRRKSCRGIKWSEDTLKESMQLLFVCRPAGYKKLKAQKYPLPSLRTLYRYMANLKDSGIVPRKLFNSLKLENLEADSEDDNEQPPQNEVQQTTANLIAIVVPPDHQLLTS